MKILDKKPSKYFNVEILLSLFLLLVVLDLKSQAYYDYDVRCLGREMDGSLTLESFGKGRNKSDASEQAKKEAVRAVIFKGIKSGNGGCETEALIINPNLERIHEDYFGIFFADDGPYLQFVSLKDESIKNKIKRKKQKDDNLQQRMVVVNVQRLALKRKLTEDKIK
jgi:hypothetical protein